jgi:hypothetical protein
MVANLIKIFPAIHENPKVCSVFTATRHWAYLTQKNPTCYNLTSYFFTIILIFKIITEHSGSSGNACDLYSGRDGFETLLGHLLS